jgi:hypothetical protein
MSDNENYVIPAQVSEEEEDQDRRYELAERIDTMMRGGKQFSDGDRADFLWITHDHILGQYVKTVMSGKVHGKRNKDGERLFGPCELADLLEKTVRIICSHENRKLNAKGGGPGGVHLHLHQYGEYEEQQQGDQPAASDEDNEVPSA